MLQDYWCWDDGSPGQCVFGGQHKLVGPAETEPHVLSDLGMDNEDAKAMAMAWRANMDAAYDTLIARKAMSWDLAFTNSYNVPAAGAATVPRPTLILPEHCEAILTRECGDGDDYGDEAAAAEALVLVGAASQREGEALDSGSCCCATARCPGACPAHCPRMRDQPLFFGLNYTSKASLSDPDVAARLPRLATDIAQFMLVRGPHAWLGFGFVSCHNDTNYTLPDAEFTRDYGVPLENCSAVPGKKGVFSRRYTNARVVVDCNARTPPPPQ
jgi:hypothetical protein